MDDRHPGPPEPGFIEQEPTGLGKVYVFQAQVGRVFSENFYLKPGYSRGRRGQGGVYLYLSPEARRYKSRLLKELEREVRNSGFPVGEEFPRRVVYNFYISKDRDVTNMIKVTEDALSEAIGVDDSVWSEVVAKKVVDGELEDEVVIIELYC